MYRWVLLSAWLGGLGALSVILGLGVVVGWWTTQIGPGNGVEALLYVSIFIGMFAFMIAGKSGVFEYEPLEPEDDVSGPSSGARPCWRCGRLAPEDADSCPSCGAAFD